MLAADFLAQPNKWTLRDIRLPRFAIRAQLVKEVEERLRNEAVCVVCGYGHPISAWNSPLSTYQSAAAGACPLNGAEAALFVGAACLPRRQTRQITFSVGTARRTPLSGFQWPAMS